MSEHELVEKHVLNRIEKDPFYFDVQGFLRSFGQTLHKIWVIVKTFPKNKRALS